MSRLHQANESKSRISKVMAVPSLHFATKRSSVDGRVLNQTQRLEQSKGSVGLQSMIVLPSGRSNYVSVKRELTNLSKVFRKQDQS